MNLSDIRKRSSQMRDIIKEINECIKVVEIEAVKANAELSDREDRIYLRIIYD